MKRYQVYRGAVWNENKCPEGALKRLEMRVVEVRCRKRCYCSVCNCGIASGDTALKTSQCRDATQRYYRHAYCSDCYRIIREAT